MYVLEHLDGDKDDDAVLSALQLYGISNKEFH